MFDISFTALLEDLELRGLLHDTLVIAIGEFGRTPKINSAAGRDHWGHVFSFALAGAGICTGQVYGSSDRDGAYPARDAVTGGDLTATLFHALGVDPESTFRDPEGRDHKLTLGSPIRPLLGGGVATYERVQTEGTVRVGGFDTSLLLNPRFEDPVPLYPVDRGSRPKGWRASPILHAEKSGFGVCLEQGDSRGPRLARMGFRAGADALAVTKGTRAVLGQEMRNPRAGRFTLAVEACLRADSKAAAESFAKHFICRLVFYRFADAGKNPLKRHEYGSLAIQPPISMGNQREWGKFELSQLLDSAGPGQNFSIGHGLGISIEIEKTSEGTFELGSVPGTQGSSLAALCIRSATVQFASRTVDDKVVV
jgi:Protein of unknown function (DUF1501)